MPVELGPTLWSAAPAGRWGQGEIVSGLPAGPVGDGSAFGPRAPILLPNGHLSGPFHHGRDPQYLAGQPLGLWAPGRALVANDADDGSGFMLIWEPEDGIRCEYYHLAEPARDYATGRDIAPGDWLTRGQVVGVVGATGWATGPHLHVGFWRRHRGTLQEIAQVITAAAPQQRTGQPLPDGTWEVWLAEDPALYMRAVITPELPPLDLQVTGPLAELGYRGFDRARWRYVRELALQPQEGDQEALLPEVRGPLVDFSFKGFDRVRWRYVYELAEQPQTGDTAAGGR
jgi:hypothetical protein